MYTSGMCSARYGFGDGRYPVIGTWLIDSTPPATATSNKPASNFAAAIDIASKPDEQNRLIVIALVVSGRPARITAIRATFIPCAASGKAQPNTTSCTEL